MVKLITKASFLTLIICFSVLVSKAQVGAEFAQFDVGASAGINQFYGDVSTKKSTQGYSFNIDFNQTPFVNYILEGQFGKLAGGSVNDPLGRQFSTDYQYYAFRLQLQLGEVIDYSESDFANSMKNLYVGAGVGIIYGKVTSITRFSKSGFYTPGEDKSNQTFLPVRIGYEFKIFNQYLQPNIKIDIGYQYNYIFGDEIDGFKSGHLNDSFSQFNIGVKFSIGVIGSYRKEINYFH
jgi:opacity protein-like surface antigen